MGNLQGNPKRLVMDYNVSPGTGRIIANDPLKWVSILLWFFVTAWRWTCRRIWSSWHMVIIPLVFVARNKMMFMYFHVLLLINAEMPKVDGILPRGSHVPREDPAYSLASLILPRLLASPGHHQSKIFFVMRLAQYNKYFFSTMGTDGRVLSQC